MPRPGEPAQRRAVSVLVVDDTPANLVALGAVLGPLDVRVVEARTGPEALERLAEENGLAVALLDVQMPGMDGFELARRMRATPNGSELPIIFLTAIHRDERNIRKGYASGGADYITKPFDPEVLRARVRAFVDLFHQRDRLRVQQVGERTRERDEALDRLASLLESERAARREADIANRAKDEFLATVSHELRTPLNAILGWTVIARKSSPAPEVAHALETIERNARSQMRIIEDVLDVGRMLGGELRLERSATRVADAIEGAVLSIRPQADAKHVALETAIDGDVGLIAADAERLQQIVWNLLANAIKFTPAGGHVHVSAERDGGRVFIRVIDDGQGIDREFLPHLFEPFRQADSSVTRRHGGLGLGLSICRQLVQAHGGTITAHSDGDGHGASFTIDLPVGDVAALQAPPARPSWRSAGPPAPPSEPASARRLEGVHLLLVDDDEDSRDLIACILEERGAEVAQASSAAEAMTLLEQEPPPDVVLSDIGMPDVSGYMLIRKIRELPSERGGRVPAVALTAYARTVDSERALEAGFQAHVTKPVDADRLTSVVAGLARGSGVEVGH